MNASKYLEHLLCAYMFAPPSKAVNSPEQTLKRYATAQATREGFDEEGFAALLGDLSERETGERLA